MTRWLSLREHELAWLVPFGVGLLLGCSSNSDASGTPSSAGSAGEAAAAGSSGTAGSAGGSASGGSAGGGNCSVSGLTCGQILPATTLALTEPEVTMYDESGHLPCRFVLPADAGGIFQVFCGGASLFASQLATSMSAYPGGVTETDTIGTKSFEQIVGEPRARYSSAEEAVLTTDGRYVFDVSGENGAAAIEDMQQLARAIDGNLGAL